MPTVSDRKKRISEVIRILRKSYPDVRCALDYTNPLELLVATILSAQCTDERVNKVTPALFKKYKKAKDYAAADPRDIEQIIRSAGFYQSKTRNIQGAARRLVEVFGGEVPRTMEELVSLPGVGRKTANVVLGNVFDIPGMPVDTHMIRLNNRLDFTREKDPVKIETELTRLVPMKDWTEYSHLIIHHGRSRCYARKPDCSACEIFKFCPRRGVTEILRKPVVRPFIARPS